MTVVSCGYTLARVSTYMGGARKTSTRAVTWSKAKKLPGNSFQKNFIFQFDCAASSPLCYAIPKKRQSSLQTHRGKWRAAAAASARKWRQFDLSTVLKQNVRLYQCVICRYNIYKKDFLYTSKF